MIILVFFFFFQAEDGIRDHCVTGVQTCALPISGYDPAAAAERALAVGEPALGAIAEAARRHGTAVVVGFAERVGREVANAVGCIGPDGAWQGCYRKTHLFGSAEWSYFVAGSDLLIADLGGSV